MGTTIESIFFDLGDTLVKNSATKTWLPGAKDLVISLKSKGFRLGILSNTGTLAPRTAILDILPLDFDINWFEPALVLFSSEVGTEKSKPAIFALAVTRSGIAAGKNLYVSESILETMVAQHVGMRSIRILTGSDDLSNLVSTIASYHLALG
jgi:FMN phosphatase YigB (HAD superfamily)